MSDELLAPNPPEDLSEFWEKTEAEAAAAPLDFRREPQSEQAREGFRIDRLWFRGIDGSRLNGWFAAPVEDGPHPAFAWLAPYGRWSMLPNEYGTRQGMCSLSFNFFGEDAFHEEEYTPKRGYFAQGLGEPETFIFRQLAQNSMIAMRVLQAQPEVDQDRMGASGMSQGAGLAIWLGASCPLVSAAVADMPFLGAMPWVFRNPVMRYPLREITDWIEANAMGRERALHTLSYFDTVNLADLCVIPTRLTLGERDPAVRPPQIKAIYDALPGEKELQRLDWGHDWHPEMIEGGRAWLLSHL